MCVVVLSLGEQQKTLTRNKRTRTTFELNLCNFNKENHILHHTYKPIITPCICVWQQIDIKHNNFSSLLERVFTSDFLFICISNGAPMQLNSNYTLLQPNIIIIIFIISIIIIHYNHQHRDGFVLNRVLFIK